MFVKLNYVNVGSNWNMYINKLVLIVSLTPTKWCVCSALRDRDSCSCDAPYHYGYHLVNLVINRFHFCPHA